MAQPPGQRSEHNYYGQRGTKSDFDQDMHACGTGRVQSQRLLATPVRAPPAPSAITAQSALQAHAGLPRSTSKTARYVSAAEDRPGQASSLPRSLARFSTPPHAPLSRSLHSGVRHHTARPTTPKRILGSKLEKWGGPNLSTQGTTSSPQGVRVI